MYLEEAAQTNHNFRLDIPPAAEGEPYWRVVASWLWPLLPGPQVTPALVCWKKNCQII